MQSKKTRDKVADLLEKGFSVIEIAHHLRVSQQAVYKHIKRYGLTLPSDRANTVQPRVS